MTAFKGKQNKYWYAYGEKDRKLLGKAVKLETLTKKFGNKNVLYSKTLTVKIKIK